VPPAPSRTCTSRTTFRKPCVKGERYPRRPVVLHHPPLFGDAHATRLRCRTSRRSTSVVPRHSPVIESSVSAYSSHCRRIGHVSPSSPCLPVVGSRPRTKSSDPGTRQAQRDVRRFHDQYSQVKTPSFSSETLAVCEPRKAGCEGGDVEIPLTPPPGPPALLAHRTGIGASRSRDMFRGSAHVSL